MVSYFGRRSRATGAATWMALSLGAALGCGAIETPFFEDDASTGGTAQGGGSGTDAGGATGGSQPNGGSAAGTNAGNAGSSAGGGDGAAPSGGSSGSGVGGASAEGGTGGVGIGGASGVAGSGTGGSGAGGGGSVDCSALDPAAQPFGNHCYLFVSDAVTWTEARQGCDERDGHLVTISSAGRSREEFEAENAFVWTLAGASDVWIGATDGRSSNQSGDGTPYAWITGEPMTFDLWSRGQPNNSSTACQEGAPCSCGDSCWEHCAFLWDPDDDEPGTWNDRHCEHLVPYVCEWDAVAMAPRQGGRQSP